MQNPYDAGIEDTGAGFDMGIATLMRIHVELMKANTYSTQNNIEGINGWFSALKVLDREISPFLKVKEEAELKVTRDKANEIPNIMRNYARQADFTLLSKRLDDYERKLRWFMKEKKLYMRGREDAATAILR